MAVVVYLCWYYPAGFARNIAPEDLNARSFLVFLFLLMFMLFTSSFSHVAIVWIETPETAGVLASLIWVLCIAFCG
jgi:ATP-binding cassette, subfamily G (WHITE), member 2, PDR